MFLHALRPTIRHADMEEGRTKSMLLKAFWPFIYVTKPQRYIY